MSYLEIIKTSLENLYTNDSKLFEKQTHEQTYSFRLALYLAKNLETDSNGLFVDCEYHSDYLRRDKRKWVSINSGKHIRPDIIYHDRKSNNIFCIELKCGAKRKDDEKIAALIRDYNYAEGYCIYGLCLSCVTIEYFNGAITEKHRLKYDPINKTLTNIVS